MKKSGDASFIGQSEMEANFLQKKTRENGSTIIYQGSLRVDFPIGRIITFALSLLYSSKKTSGICKKSKRKSAAQSDFLIFPFLFKKKKKGKKKKVTSNPQENYLPSFNAHDSTPSFDTKRKTESSAGHSVKHSCFSPISSAVNAKTWKFRFLALI